MVLPVATVTGFILLIVGSMGYMGTIAIGDILSNTLMVIGLLVVIAGMALMMYQNRTAGNTQEEE